MSNRQAALTVLRTRLQGILVTNGYSTDAGALVFMGEHPVLGDSDPDASLAVVVRADRLVYQGEAAHVIVPVAVQVIVKAGPDAWATQEAAIADVKTAVEQDHDLGKTLIPRGLERGSTVPMDREAGSQFVGVEVEYTLQYREGWGHP